MLLADDSSKVKIYTMSLAFAAVYGKFMWFHQRKRVSGLMQIVWAKVLPVIVSIGIIIAVAIIKEYSTTFAAIAATMPINIPLALWIQSSGDNRGQETVMADFTQAIFINMFPTMVFAFVVWQAAKAGWSLVPMLLAGYVGWGLVLGIIFLARHWWGA
jgi:hypothetical protein